MRRYVISLYGVHGGIIARGYVSYLDEDRMEYDTPENALLFEDRETAEKAIEALRAAYQGNIYRIEEV